MRISGREFDEKNDYFADNFSQYVHTQFIQQINRAESSDRNAPNPSRLAKNSERKANLVPQCQEIVEEDNDLDEVIPPGQRTMQDHSDLTRNECNETVSFDPGIADCSQLFLNEISCIQINVNSIIDHALHEEKFSIFKSNVTTSDYMQLHRDSPNEEAMETLGLDETKNEPDEDGDAQIVENVRKNEFDSLLEAGMDDFDDIIDTSLIEGENGRKLLPSEKQVVVHRRARPVNAAYFYNLGPFYGLPNKVLNLIKQYKGIDGLYGNCCDQTALCTN